jgi:glycosyltransferase involved in cell wall biosynthesis
MVYDLSIIIPCYNEARNLARLKRHLMPVVDALGRTWSVELIFVDDGSSDSTGKLFEMAFRGWMFPSARLPVRISVLRHTRRRGMSGALRTGFVGAHGNVILTADCGGGVAFGSIPGLFGKIRPGVDIVVGCQNQPQSKVNGIPTWRLQVNRWIVFLYRVLVDRKISSYLSPFRVYRRWVMEEYEFHTEGDLACTDLLVKALLDGVCVEEYPAAFNPRQDGLSKSELVSFVAAHLKFLGRVLFHRLGIKPFLGVAHPNS